MGIRLNITNEQDTKRTFFYIPGKYRVLFPISWKDFQIEDPYANETYMVHCVSDYRIPGLGSLFQKYQFLTEGYVFYLEVVEDKKKYRLRFDNLEDNKKSITTMATDQNSEEIDTNLELLTYETEYYSNISVKEGQKILYLHYGRERKQEIINLTKALALRNNKELRCEVCGFSFFEHYGDRGKNFIEGHHIKPIGLIDENIETKIEDIRLICSNCHRMIHRKFPWLTIEELKSIYRL